MTVEQFLQAVEQNRKRVKQYHLGMDGTDGLCDCVGLPIGAVRLSGNKWTGTHGSNYAARNRVKNLHPSSDGVRLGELVFKAYEKGEAGWNLPDTYAGHSDQRDYYHVGVITSIDPLCITHCTSVPGGIKKDDKVGNWKWCAELDIVEEGEPMEQKTATVVCTMGSTVNVRKQATTSSAVLTAIKKGTKVTVTGKNGTWYAIEANGVAGYMMGQFLSFDEEEGEDTVTVQLPRSVYDALKEALDK